MLAPLLVLALVALGACGGDDGDEAATTTTEDTADEATEEPTEEPTDEPTETSAPLDDSEFAAEIASFEGRLDEAGTDPCALNDIITGTAPPDPANPAQSEQLVGLYAALLRAIAASAPDAPDVADGFSAAADELEAEAAEAGYPPDLLSAAAQLPPSLSSEEFLAANTGFQQLVNERCEPSEPAGPAPGTDAPTG